ncbi:unnamed protein product [Aureobasidium mustum]|uniref:MYND-type domain-containing protein n=1 Tax=Aureobasidium mustum TaxID=2773714 RepID=A0A9N8P948_9PEZI|nr:unnamed protein product [Aureobasidium mustum]
MLDDSADLNRVKEKILADRARYSFPKTEKKNASDKDSDAGDNTEDDHIHMSLYNSSHPELILTYQKCRLPPEGEVRFGKALRDYRNGVPYPFNSKGLQLTAETGNPFYKESEIFWMRLEEVPAGEEITQENTTIERVYGDFNQPVDVCGNCGTKLYCGKTCQKVHTPKHSCLCPGFRKAHEEQPADACGNCGAKQTKDGSALKRCARCKNRNYCSVECQKEHYHAHVSKCKTEAEETKEKENGRRVMGLNVLQTW